MTISIMQYIDQSILTQLKLPAKGSHKGENGRLTIIGGSKLFHGSLLLALTVASRIVDMVYFVSVMENLELVKNLKTNLNAFIAVPFGKENDYIAQSDAILIGPGMVRGDEEYSGTGESGVQTRERVLSVLKQFPDKKWVLDAGALQSIKAEEVLSLGVKNPIITPHKKEFKQFFGIDIFPLVKEGTHLKDRGEILQTAEIVLKTAKKYACTIVLKGPVDVITDGKQVLFNQTGNEGMTKGGTGDVLAGLVAALATTNDPFIAAAAGAYINGLAGDELYKTAGPYFNADKLAMRVPEVLWEEIVK